MNLKKGNQVKIITGKDKGKTGEILEINKKLKRLSGWKMVKGRNAITKSFKFKSRFVF